MSECESPDADQCADYCGCCGAECGPDQFWCLRCQQHVLHNGPLWDRTYFAQHGTDCPVRLKFPYS